MGLLGAGHVPASFLRVGDPFGRPFEQGFEVALLTPLEGFQGCAGEEVLHVLEGALVRGLPCELEVPLRGEGVDPRLPGRRDLDFRAGEVRLDAGPQAGDFDRPLRGPAVVEGLPELARGLRPLRGLDEALRDGHVDPLRAFRGLCAPGGVQRDPGLPRPRPPRGGLGHVGPARGAGVGALHQRGLTQGAGGHWKLPQNGTSRIGLALERGPSCINMMAAVISGDNDMAFSRRRESPRKP